MKYILLLTFVVQICSFCIFLKYHRNIPDNGKSYCARKFGMDIIKTKDIVAFIFIYTHIYCKNPRCL